MKKICTILLIALFPVFLLAGNEAQNTPITNDLMVEMAEAGHTEQFRINIRLTEQYDAEAFAELRQNMNREQRRSFVVNELKAFTALSQQPIMAEINSLVQAGEVSHPQSLWIANVINCYATPAAIEQLAQRSDVERIDIDEERILIDPVEFTDVAEDQLREITYNVLIMNVPDVWDLGFTGEGIVVAVLDTGVNYNHVDLVNNMWTHPDFPFHGWNFTNNTNNPMDFHGHGTHCAGTVAGDGTAGSQTGMAPDAKIMALQVLTASGGGTESGVWNAIQFGVEHGAHVLSLSLGWQHSWGPDRATWRNTMDNALAAGVVAAVAAGNEGNQQGSYPIPSNVRTPGDIPAPWRHPDQPDTGSRSAVVCVGATNQGDALAGFSSRGPVTWQNISPYNDYQYNPGVGLIRPDVVAPGVDVKSLRHNNNTGYTTMSGTSMATPGVAGVMALMLSKNPNLTPEQISQILEETALPLAPNKNNSTGSGRVDALEAVLNTGYQGPVYDSHSFNDEEGGNNNGQINPGESIYLNLALVNNAEQSFENVTATIWTPSPYITIIEDNAFFGNFEEGDVVEVENAFFFEVADDIPGTHQVEFNIEATDGDAIWKSTFVAIAGAPRLVFSSFTIDDSQGNNDGFLDAGEIANINIQIMNGGQMVAFEPLAKLTISSPFISLVESEIVMANIPPLGAGIASFPVSVSEAAPIGEPFTLTAVITYGAYEISRTYNLRISPQIEDFESGDFTHFEWEFAGNEPWTVVDSPVFEGSYSARSGNIGNSQVSRMRVTMDVAKPDSIRFWLRVSSEQNFDFLRFYIGNSMQAQWSGDVSWREVVIPVGAGEQIFRWDYQKNASVSHGSDAAWIDFIQFPGTLSTVAFAGQDAFICEGQDFQTMPIIRNAAEIAWHSEGDGSFDDPQTENPVYTPGDNDIANGSVVLGVTVTGIDNEVKSHEMTLTVSPPVVAFAGDNREICIGSVLEIAEATATNHAGVLWETSGTGHFEALHELETVYVPSEEDYTSGMVLITLIAHGHGQCEDVHASFELHFSPEPEVSMAETMEVCNNTPIELSAEASYYSSVLWTSNGTGSFENESSLEAVYHPSQADIDAGEITFTLAVNGVEGCGETEGMMQVSFIAAPAVTVSGNMDLCPGEGTEITLHLSGQAPWVIDMGEGFEEITSDEPEFVLSLNPETTTTYTIVSLSDNNGCQVADAVSFTLSRVELPLAPATPEGPEVVDYYETTQSSYTITGVDNASTYTWKLEPESAGTMNPDGTTVLIDWNTDYTGVATLSVKAGGMCGDSDFSEMLAIDLKNTTSLHELSGIGKMVFYPNPSDGLLNLEFTSREPQQLTLIVTNQLGQVVYSGIKDVAAGKTSSIIDLTMLDSGLYQLAVQNENGLIIRKLMINR